MPMERGAFTHSEGYRLEYRIDAPLEPTDRRLHVLFHGFSRIEAHVPPVFARVQWSGAQQAVCLFLSDPIHLYTKDSACGWFLLGEDEFLPRVLDLRGVLLERYGLEGTVWHGLSSGGYAALKYCMRAGDDDLAFVISPHNDPAILPQWEAEAAPFAGLPGMAAPRPTVESIAGWAEPGRARYLHAVISERDSYFALEHLRPIMELFRRDESLGAVMLRDGRGHGFIADQDYEAQLNEAVRRWESRRDRVRPRETGSDVEVVLSSYLAGFANQQKRLHVTGGTVRQVVDRVCEIHPQLRSRMIDQVGRILPFVNIYVGDDSIRDIGSLDAALTSQATVTITSAVAGG